MAMLPGARATPCRELPESDTSQFSVRSWTHLDTGGVPGSTRAMSNESNPYMFIATEPLGPMGPMWFQTGCEGKQQQQQQQQLQNIQNDAWHSWLASNYVWIPSYIAYGLVDMVPWHDAVAPIAVADSKGGHLALEKPCQKGKESALKRSHEGKSSLAPDERLG